MRNDFRVQIRINHNDVFGGFVDAPDAKTALELAVAEALSRDLSCIKGSRDKLKIRSEEWKRQVKGAM